MQYLGFRPERMVPNSLANIVPDRTPCVTTKYPAIVFRCSFNRLRTFLYVQSGSRDFSSGHAAASSQPEQTTDKSKKSDNNARGQTSNDKTFGLSIPSLENVLGRIFEVIVLNILYGQNTYLVRTYNIKSVVLNGFKYTF